VITGLKEANAGNAPFCSSRHAVAHQCASNSPILHSRIDRDRTDACNRRPLIHKIAANDLVIDFGNDCVKSWICDKLRDQSNRYFRRGQIGRKIMLISDCCECFITNCAAALRVIRCGPAQLYVHRNCLVAVAISACLLGRFRGWFFANFFFDFAPPFAGEPWP
jgi:hypothetical protein